MEIDIFTIKFNNVDIARREIPKIRGFIANKYTEFDELHNHNGSGFIYRYPLIQYKMIDNKPGIVGINQGTDILMNIENDIDYLNINGKNIGIYEKEMRHSRNQYGETDSLIKYEFQSPWMCLNSNNYENFEKADEQSKVNLIKRILIGNILSMSKGFQYTVSSQITAFTNFKYCEINFKNNKMIGIKGEFLVNFVIPDFLGLGKSVSRGFGTIKKIKGDKYR